jgi:hypothetical protein
MNSYIKNIDNIKLRYANQVAHHTLWKQASSQMRFNINTLPSYLNYPVKSELVFSCDRRVWQSGIFFEFIYNPVKNNTGQYAIDSNELFIWAKRKNLLNNFAPILWRNTEKLESEELSSLQAFDFHSSIEDFFSSLNLENEGCLVCICRKNYLIISDKIELTNEINVLDINLLTDDQLEQYHERAGIMEHCGGLELESAEKLAYSTVVGI